MPRLGDKGELRTALDNGTFADLQAVLRARCLIDESDPDSCWIWDGSRNGSYGYVRVSETSNQYAHRVMWRKAYARIPDGMQVHHRCANSLCIRLDHLQLVNDEENQAEMQARRALENRIIDLEEALRQADPDHPTLAASLDRAVNSSSGARWTPPAERMERRRAARALRTSHRLMRAKQVDEVQTFRAGGMTVATACLRVGVHPSTYYKWLAIEMHDAA